MIELSLQACAVATGGRLVGVNVHFSSVSTDTRTLHGGELLVALRGRNFDAHDKIDAEVARRCCALVVQRLLHVDVPQLLVEDTLQALGEIARQWRRQLRAAIIAITGSNGKTTVKEMSAAILRRRGAVFSTPGNLNNAIGMPLSLLSSGDWHDYVVLELGANHSGEIDYLTRIAQPRVALVNNAEPSHLEGFGSLDGIASAKGEIYAGLDESGIAVINADDHYAPLWRDMADDRPLISFGFEPGADLCGRFYDNGELRIIHRAASVVLSPPLPGMHNAMNALAAAAAAVAVGATLEEVAAGLAEVHSISGRLQFKAGVGGTQIIDDSYNANPGSLRAGLAVLCEGAAGSTWCVLGDMRELGNQSVALHREMGATARRLGVDCVYAIGEYAEATVAGFGSAACAFDSLKALVQSLQGALRKGDRVLVKGSRGAHMERVVSALVDDVPEPEARWG